MPVDFLILLYQIAVLLHLICSTKATSTFGIYRSSCRRDALFKATDRDAFLKGDVKKEIESSFLKSLSLCARRCMQVSQCQSINYKKNGLIADGANCVLLDIVKSSTGASLVSGLGWIHYEPVNQVNWPI